jgi:hypothetical protein
MNAFSLSFKEGNPLAYVPEGKRKGKILHINQNSQDGSTDDKEDISALIEDFIRNCPERLNFRQIKDLEHALLNEVEPSNPVLANVYRVMKMNLASAKNKEIIIKDSKIVPIIDPTTERQVFYITGMSGSGKTTYVNMLIDSYVKFYKGKRKVFLFSNKEWDNSYTNKHITKIQLNEELVEEPLSMDELITSLVIMDDIEGVPNKAISNELDRIRDLILQQGRQYKISFCYVSHLANNYKQTRTILNECHCVVVFPYMTTAYSLKYLLEKYFGFDKKQIARFQKLNSRWVCIWKSPTISVMYENGAYLLN